MSKISAKDISLSDFSPNYQFNLKYAKSHVLSFLVRNYSISQYGEKGEIIKSLSKEKYIRISNKTAIPKLIAKDIIDRFLKEVYYFRQFLDCFKFKWPHDPRGLYRKEKILLHKIYQILPVFHYKRARYNLKILHNWFQIKNFWPIFTTQMAIVIFITDTYDKTASKPIIQKNIRFLCNCSAYAYHRTRNMIDI